jgi:hypothetical protein
VIDQLCTAHFAAMAALSLPPCPTNIAQRDRAKGMEGGAMGRIILNVAAKQLTRDEARRSSLAMGSRKDKRPELMLGPFGEFLNEAHVPFDFFCVPLCFFAMALLLDIGCAPTRRNGGALQTNGA